MCPKTKFMHVKNERMISLCLMRFLILAAVQLLKILVALICPVGFDIEVAAQVGDLNGIFLI